MAVFGPNKRRKIPVPKRHGVRDPLKKLAEREAAIKDKINNPPKERDVQEVSNRFKQFVKLKAQTKNATPLGRKQQLQRRIKKRSTLRVGSSVVQQHPKESEEAFLERASAVQRDHVLEARFSSKYNVEVERNEDTGAVKLKKKKTHEIDELLKRKAEEAKGYRKKQKRKVEVKKLSLAEKRAIKKQKIEDKKRKEEDKLLEEYQQDTVQFGEVVHGPPTLNTKPRHADKLNGAARPGHKGLLLHTLFNPVEQNEEVQEEITSRKKSSKKQEQKVDLKGKRKNLPMVTRVKLEREQQNVIEMYRQMKKAK
ncbi:nucleolar protein 58 [Topomyia yanbarensis]|uniref:nucleolar protein 58 n=1 Tax=Topomyia yanbarensis TaxID=2498891 RepID=UPI00273BA036|nr:nucleolar protein 58 [Topomyia yanbarensis]